MVSILHLYSGYLFDILFSSYLYSILSHTTVFIAGILFVRSHPIFCAKCLAILIVRSASFHISNERSISKSFFIFAEIVGSVILIHQGIFNQTGRLLFKSSLVMLIFFNISFVFFAPPPSHAFFSK
jgi:hypothetical protein